MNKQEAFDKAWHGVIKQDKPCMAWMDNKKSPRLKFNGASCAIGFLIPDDKYLLKMEYEDINTMECLADLQEPVDDYRSTFLEDLRDCHDMSVSHFLIGNYGNVTFTSSFKTKMKALAKKHKLTIPSEK